MVRWLSTAALCLLTALAAEARIEISDDMRLQKDGETYAVVVDCPQPGSKVAKEKYFGGSQKSKIGDDPCGECLINANWGVYLKYPYDLLIKGVLLDENGEPHKNKLVHFFFPNGWTVKTRSSPIGYFRIIMGATAERKSSKMLEMDLGKRYLKEDSVEPFYAFYVLPENFKHCSAE